ncbi:MAG TPA: amidohydrolase/deacetylase family metallohydrolase [Bryobacteraceae bacterium]|nr:amidohydrolase/deacetylase family metallohydrolase [Bryobacteraceae bacterium]
MVRILPVFLALSACLMAQNYDVLLKGGHVIDPKNNINAVRDVAIKDRKIAAVAVNIPAAEAKKVVDVKGLYVMPGLIDLHVHVFYGDGPSYRDGQLSVIPDSHSFRSGVTTMVDAGTSGWRNYEVFKKRIIDRSKTRVLTFLNIVGDGMGGAVEQNMQDMDPAPVVAMIKKYPDNIVGIKTAHFAGPEWIAVDSAVKAGEAANVPIMVDFGSFRLERPHQELILKHLRPGDMYTHAYLAAVPMLDENGKVRQYLFDGKKRGVKFDAGHGGGSFVFRWAVPAIKQGFVPDSISTDLHTSSMIGGMKDMTNVMSKFLNMGMSLQQVVEASTWHPAQQIKRTDLGHLSVGATADVTVLNVQTGTFGFVDVYGAKMMGTKNLVAEMTMKDGRFYWDLNGRLAESWDKLDKRYNAQGNALWDGTISGGVRARK